MGADHRHHPQRSPSSSRATVLHERPRSSAAATAAARGPAEPGATPNWWWLKLGVHQIPRPASRRSAPGITFSMRAIGATDCSPQSDHLI